MKEVGALYIYMNLFCQTYKLIQLIRWNDSRIILTMTTLNMTIRYSYKICTRPIYTTIHSSLLFWILGIIFNPQSFGIIVFSEGVVVIS